MTSITIIVLIGIPTVEQALAVNTQKTFHNTSNDYAMIELSDSTANCIVQPDQSCVLNTEPKYYTVTVCVTYCSSDNLFLYTDTVYTASAILS